MEQYTNFFINHWQLSLLALAIVFAIIAYELYLNLIGPKGIDTKTLIHLINNEDSVVFDIRDKAAFKRGHIINSLNIQLSEVENDLSKLEKYKNKHIIIVCDVGQKSNAFVGKLIKNGFEKTKFLMGGIKSWQEANLPLEKG